MSKWRIYGLTALVCVFWTEMASAQQIQETFVASTGADGNTCAQTSPCRTFAGALTKTSPSGQVNVIDSGEYGTFNITQSVSIVANNVTATVSPNSTFAITINITSGSGIVSLKGLTLAGGPGNSNGVYVRFADTVQLENMDISGFSNGIFISSNPQTRVNVYHSKVYQNMVGIGVAAGSNVNGLVIQESSLDYNTSANISVNGSNNAVLIGKSSIQGGPITILSGQPSLQSYGDNDISSSYPATIIQRQ